MFILLNRKKLTREEQNLIKQDKEKPRIDYYLFQKVQFFCLISLKIQLGDFRFSIEMP